MGASNSLSLSLSDLARCFLHCEARGVPFISSNFWRSRVYVRHTKKKRKKKKGRKKQFENVFSVRGEERAWRGNTAFRFLGQVYYTHRSYRMGTSKKTRRNWDVEIGRACFRLNDRRCTLAKRSTVVQVSSEGLRDGCFFFFLSLFFNSRAPPTIIL